MSAYSSHCVGCGKVSVCLRANLCPACLEGAYLAMRAELERVRNVICDWASYESEHISKRFFEMEAESIAKLLEKYPV